LKLGKKAKMLSLLFLLTTVNDAAFPESPSSTAPDTLKLSNQRYPTRVAPKTTLLNDTNEDLLVYVFSFNGTFLPLQISDGSRILKKEYVPSSPFWQFLLYPTTIRKGTSATIEIQGDLKAPLYLTNEPGSLSGTFPQIGSRQTGTYLEIAFAGMVLMMLLYMIGKYVQIGTPDYLFYTLSLLFTLAYLIVIMFEASVSFWHSYPYARPLLQHIFQTLSHLAYFQFVRFFIQTPIFQPGFDKALNAATLLGVIYLLVDIPMMAIFQVVAYPHSTVWNGVRIFLLIFGVASLLIWVRTSSHSLKNYLAFGTAAVLLGSLAGFLLSLFPNWLAYMPGLLNQQVLYFRAGIIIEIIFFSLGLGYKHRLDEKAKLQAEAKLEKEHLQLVSLREMDKMKSSFFSGISHEFRTPLTLIMSHSEEQLRLGTEPRTAFQSIASNGRKLLHLITQLLELSRIEAGSFRLKMEKIAIVSFTCEKVKAFYPIARQKDIKLIETYPPKDQEVVTDGVAFEMIINNLVSNAIKYTHAKGEVTVSLELMDEELVLSVSDTGMGIPKKHHHRVFDRFFRVHEDEEGTGIGLALVKELTGMLLGKLKMESAPGVGTTFTIKIPAKKVPIQPAKNTATDYANNGVARDFHVGHPTSATQNTPNGLQTMLVIEDHQELRNLIVDCFKDSFEIFACENGRQGLSYAHTHVPDIIITDWMMPEMDGLELCQRLKSDEATSHIPVLMLTAKAGQESKIQGLETGADGYLTKPFDARELKVSVRNLLQQRDLLRAKYSIGLPFDISKIPSADEKFIHKFYEVISLHYANPELNIPQLAREIGMSRVQLHRKLVALTGRPASDLLREYRLQRASELLASKSGNISEIAWQTGFDNLSYFTKIFRQQFGCNPSEYKRTDTHQTLTTNNQ
jgi:signal transduction histidine kinase/DNA-binding response OmpR family regulator